MADKIPVVFCDKITYNLDITKEGRRHEKNINGSFNLCHGTDHGKCVPGNVVQRTGAKRRKKPERCRKMHHRYGQGFKSDMFFAPLCQMHRHGRKQKMQRMAGLARPARPVKTLLRLENGGLKLLPRKRVALKKVPGYAGIFFMMINAHCFYANSSDLAGHNFLRPGIRSAHRTDFEQNRS